MSYVCLALKEVRVFGSGLIYSKDLVYLTPLHRVALSPCLFYDGTGKRVGCKAHER